MFFLLVVIDKYSSFVSHLFRGVMNFLKSNGRYFNSNCPLKHAITSTGLNGTYRCQLMSNFFSGRGISEAGLFQISSNIQWRFSWSSDFKCHSRLEKRFSSSNGSIKHFSQTDVSVTSHDWFDQ